MPKKLQIIVMNLCENSERYRRLHFTINDVSIVEEY